MSAPIIFTENAAAKVFELIQEEGNLSLKLRAYVTGGGCSGMQYGFTFTEKAEADDTVIVKSIIVKSIIVKSLEMINGANKEKEQAMVELLVDPLSLQYLLGAEIDYQEDIAGAQFIIRNPNAKTTCGCGSSFTTE